MKRNLKYYLQLSLVLSAFSVNAQDITSGYIDSLVNAAMITTPHAGMAVLVVKGDETILAKGYGFQSAKTKKKVDKHTRFAIASNSKAFTSAALAILVDRGKIDWNDRVVKYIPEFTMYNPYVTANFTIIDLLTHRSGLGLGAGDLMFFPDGGDFTIDDVIKSFQYQEVKSDFRTKYDYDNLLYVVAGELIKRVSGQAWSDFVADNIMTPLGMAESAGTHQRLVNKKNIANPHSVIDDQLVELEAMEIEMGAAAAGIYASVDDLCKWVKMHLNGGLYGDSIVMISAKNHSKLWYPYTVMGYQPVAKPPYNTHLSAYGLGWKIGDKKGYSEVSHTGGLPGMLSKTTLIPELDIAVVVLTNAAPGGYSYHTITAAIIDKLLGVEDQNWVQIGANAIDRGKGRDEEITDKVWEVCESADRSHLDMKDYVGTYSDDWFGDVKIYEEGGKVFIKCFRSPKLHGEMHFYKANTFAIKWAYQDMQCDAFASFSLDTEGMATSIAMKGISPNIDFSFDFHDLDLIRKSGAVRNVKEDGE